MIKTKVILITLLLCGYTTILCSCTPGIIYTDTVRPLTIDMQNAENSDTSATGSNFMLTEPFTAPGIRIEWASRGIGDVAKLSNFKEVYYADLHTFSILLGIYRVKKLIIYGKKGEVVNSGIIKEAP